MLLLLPPELLELVLLHFSPPTLLTLRLVHSQLAAYCTQSHLWHRAALDLCPAALELWQLHHRRSPAAKLDWHAFYWQMYWDFNCSQRLTMASTSNYRFTQGRFRFTPLDSYLGVLANVLPTGLGWYRVPWVTFRAGTSLAATVHMSMAVKVTRPTSSPTRPSRRSAILLSVGNMHQPQLPAPPSLRATTATSQPYSWSGDWETLRVQRQLSPDSHDAFLCLWLNSGADEFAPLLDIYLDFPFACVVPDTSDDTGQGSSSTFTH
eukprot:TRINITY_DN9647_c0_g1_i1.p1 TRINITY_DN9647_c0_g1~~TRINITY_DN9647_c0_g1_i1.p1  ORF type:complete len:264 (+),score=19.81 TRINITY_DN9647_c0_g1_i1:29-820(+)